MFKTGLRSRLLGNISHQCSIEKILCWALFLVFMVGYWNYQHLFILATYSGIGITRLTIICLLVVLTLLPYSLSHRIRMSSQWYALAFCPSLIILALVANEQPDTTSIVGGAILILVFILLSIRPPLLNCPPIISNLCIIIIATIATLLISNTNELTHNRYKIENMLANHQYEDALLVGAKSLNTDSAVFNLRAQAMIHTHQIGDKLFVYPIPASGTRIQFPDNDLDAVHDILLCNLLLSKQLSKFANQLPQYYDLQAPSLPRHYKEALVLYLSTTANPAIKYSDVITDANYHDFLSEKQKYSNTTEAANKCRQLYGDTYFWYYHYFNSEDSQFK